jgi:hypothetical protein
VKGFGPPDHVRDRRCAGVAQKHGVLGFMTEGGSNFYVVPGAGINNDVGFIIPV